jgi:hypothetical protein
MDYAQSVLPQRGPQAEAERLERVRDKLREVFDEAARAARSVGHAFALAQELNRMRFALAHVLRTLGTFQSEREHELVLREAELAYLRQYERFSRAPGRSELLRAWTNLLVEATAKVERDQAEAEEYAAVAAEQTDDDRAWRGAAGSSARDRW